MDSTKPSGIGGEGEGTGRAVDQFGLPLWRGAMSPTKAFLRKLEELRNALRASLAEARKCCIPNCGNLADHVVFVNDGALMWERDAPVLHDQAPLTCGRCTRQSCLADLAGIRALPVAWVLDGRDLFRKVTRIELAMCHDCGLDCRSAATAGANSAGPPGNV